MSVREADAPQAVAAPAQTPQVVMDHRARLIVYGSVLLAIFLAAIDQTVVATALPRIVTDLQGADRFVWVVTAYLLASTVTIPMYGKFSDVYGRKTMLLSAIALFLVGSWLSGLSQSMDQLIAFRALQGLGAGGIFPVAIATVGDLFDARERGRYQGAIGAVGGLSFLIGPFVGGWFTEHASWHWIFYVNIPIGIVALIAVARLLPNRRLVSARARDLDYLGIALFTAGFVPLLIGFTNKGEIDLTTGQPYNWADVRVAAPMILGLLLLGLFLFVEPRAKHAIIPLDLFKNPDYALSMAVTFLVGLGAFVGVILMPRFFQTVRGIDATTSGYFIFPLLFGMMLSSIGIGILISRTGRYKWLIAGSTVLLVVGAFLMMQLSTSTPDWQIWLFLLPIGLGIGPSIAGFTIVVQSLVPSERMGVASGTLTVLRQIGTVVGLAVAGTVFSSAYEDRLPVSLGAEGVPHDLVARLAQVSGALQGVGNAQLLLHHIVPPALAYLIPKVIAGTDDAFSHATGTAFEVTLIGAIVAFALTLLLHDKELKGGRGAVRT